MKRIFKILLIILGGLFLGSCTKEDYPPVNPSNNNTSEYPINMYMGEEIVWRTDSTDFEATNLHITAVSVSHINLLDDDKAKIEITITFGYYIKLLGYKPRIDYRQGIYNIIYYRQEEYLNYLRNEVIPRPGFWNKYDGADLIQCTPNDDMTSSSLMCYLNDDQIEKIIEVIKNH